MKNTNLIIIIMVILLGGYFVYRNMMTPNQATDSTAEQSMMEEGFSGTFKAAMALGVPMKCDYTLEDGTVATGYIKNGMYYGQTTVDEEVGNILVKDNCSWTWSETTKEGVTFCSDPEDVAAMAEDATAEKPTVDPETVNVPEGDFDCTPTIVDDSLFEPPTDVTFTDFSALMEGFDPETMMTDF